MVKIGLCGEKKLLSDEFESQTSMQDPEYDQDGEKIYVQTD